MRNAEAAALRNEYDALVRVANGLVSAILTGTVCNTLTMARMADEARAAARKVASVLEQLTRRVCNPLRMLAAAVLGMVRNVLIGLVPG